MTPVLLLASQALAAPYVVDVGSPQTLAGVGGNWARIHFIDDQPWLTWGWNQDLYVAELDLDAPSATIDEANKRQLTDRGDLSDHGVARCPDGSFAHVASASLDSPNDSAFAWRFDSGWQELASGTVEEREPSRAHNDMAVVCSDLLVGVGFHDFSQQQAELFELTASATAGTLHELPDAPVMTGAAILRDPQEDFLLMSGNALTTGAIDLERYDADLQHLDGRTITPLPDGWDAFWPQGLLAAGDVYLLATLGRPDTASRNSDIADVFLVILDRDLQVLETAQITTTNGASSGCLRPGLARRGTSLFVTCDLNNELVVTEVILDLAAMGVDPDEDEDWDGEDPWDEVEGGDSGSDGGGGDEDEDEGPGAGCGCAAGPTGGAGLLALAVGLFSARRRQRGPARPG